MSRPAAGKRAIIIDTAIDIARRPETVWPYLVDWEHLDRWMKEGKGFKVTSGHREGVGVTAEATIKVGGISTTDPVRVARWEPPELLEIEHLGWVAGTGAMRCTPAGETTRLVWQETLYPPWGTLGYLGLSLYRPFLRRVFNRDLRLLKNLVEGEAAA